MEFLRHFGLVDWEKRFNRLSFNFFKRGSNLHSKISNDPQRSTVSAHKLALAVRELSPSLSSKLRANVRKTPKSDHQNFGAVFLANGLLANKTVNCLFTKFDASEATLQVTRFSV